MNWEAIRQAAVATVTAQIARGGLSTELARVAPRAVTLPSRRRTLSPRAKERKKNAPIGRTSLPIVAATRLARAPIQRARRASAGWTRLRTRLAPRSSRREQPRTQRPTARWRRRLAAIIAPRSGFFFALGLAGPARAFFMRRSRPSPEGLRFIRPRFNFTLTLRPCHVASH